jgi:hypothetical protein
LHIHYAHKSALKKWTITRLKPVLYTLTSLAAAWLIYVGVVGVLHNAENTTKPFLAGQKIKANAQELSNNLGTELKKEEKKLLTTDRIAENKLAHPVARMYSIPVRTPDKSTTTRELIMLSTMEPHVLSQLDLPYRHQPGLMISSELPGKTRPETGYLSIREYAIRQIKTKVLSEGKNESQDQKITFWEVAEVGVDRIGKLTGSDMKLDRKVDESGKLVALAFESKSLGFSHTIRK